MGIWGTGLYDNDYTADIRDSFVDYLDQGLTPLAAKRRILKEFQEIFESPDEGPLAKLALAEQLLIMKVLTVSEKNDALAYIQNGGDLDCWEDNSPEFNKRQEEFSRLANLFISYSMGTIHSKPKAHKNQFEWQIGQVYALPISTETADPLQLMGEYFLLYIWGEGTTMKGYRTPLVWVKMTKGGKIPETVREFNDLEYIQVACTAMADRFKPFANENEIPEEYKQQYRPDKWGFLPEFTMQIYESRGNHPPTSMFLLKPFEGINPPEYNYRRYRSAHGSAWRYLEEYIIQCYCLHNLRQAQFYTK